MKFSLWFLIFTSAVSTSQFSPCPRSEDIKDASLGSQHSGQLDSFELLGDLRTLPQSKLTSTGRTIKGLLVGHGNPESDEVYRNVPDLQSNSCKKDTCCVWYYVAKDMEDLFRGPGGKCNKWARFAVRLGFHDAGSWNKFSSYGGADGSIVLAPEERLRPDNRGLEEIIVQVEQWYKKFHDDMGFHSVTHADIIQVSASVATVVCPLGPRMRTYVGRPDDSRANIDGLLPSVVAPAAELIQLFRDKTIGPHGLVALVGAHTTSQQRFVNESRALDPQDSTPGVWDVLFYGETLRRNPPKRVFRFQSDENLANYHETRGEWKEFAGRGGQNHWNEDYAREYIRLSLLGVQNINDMTECTKVLPHANRGFSFPNQARINKWLTSMQRGGVYSKIGEDLSDGKDVDEKDVESVQQDGDITTLEVIQKDAEDIE